MSKDLQRPAPLDEHPLPPRPAPIVPDTPIIDLSGFKVQNF